MIKIKKEIDYNKIKNIINLLINKVNSDSSLCSLNGWLIKIQIDEDGDCKFELLHYGTRLTRESKYDNHVVEYDEKTNSILHFVCDENDENVLCLEQKWKKKY